MATANQRRSRAAPADDKAIAPVVVVGAGPVGMRVAQELCRRDPATPVVLYGEEASEPYNRVRLSSFLVGELSWQALTRDSALPPGANIETRYGCRVTAIDRESRCVRDATGFAQPYSRLVLATGSRPYVPDIPGIKLPGVYTFRDVRDAHRLLARRVRSRRTVVLGGGLLGLEAARAMQRFHTEVCVVEHYSRLMMRQLDEGAARELLARLEALGIEVVLGDGVKRVLGDAAVSGIQLRSERLVECDTLLVATGILPNTELALAAGLPIGRGVRVNDRMQTPDPDIYAVGECAEHRNRVYGIVAPGLEQATVAAHAITGGRTRYNGSTVATRLKVVDLPVFSMGPVTGEETPSFGRAWVSRAGSSYRKLVTLHGRLVGAIAVGDCPELSRLQEAVMRQRRVWPWQLLRFARTGSLWPEEEMGSVVAWPAAATVCNCTGVTRGELGRALAGGCATVESLAARTGASTVCGSCRPLLAELAGSTAVAGPVRGWKMLLGSGGFAALATLALALVLVPYTVTVQVPWQWDVLWRESFWKQVSGFSVLGLSAVLLAMSLRKRMPRVRLGDFSLWRVAHAALGALTLIGLAAHTGGRLGANLNFFLMAAFLGVVALGAVAGGAIALEHRLGAGAARLRGTSLWTHILIAWPIPVLLAFHVFKTYYF
ncbi:MAG: NAD(P)/FAD-dependent oxidoreductase [Betaproteobacteria bacterium]|nr:NAD(P)/FAD-dependent oxidoreductase [Betaproteobacteria bacterium]